MLGGFSRMPEKTELAVIKDVLATHKHEVGYLHAETMALQALLVGLMNGLVSAGVDRSIMDEAFDYAAHVAMVGSESLDSQQPVRALHIIDELRETVVTDTGARSRRFG